MANVTARYWGIRRARDVQVAIAEVEFYGAAASPLELAQLTGSSYFSQELEFNQLSNEVINSMNGNINDYQVIVDDVGRSFGIALDCAGQTAVRAIVLRNTPNFDASSFVPFGIDTLSYFVASPSPQVSKIQKYSIIKTPSIGVGELGQTYNYYYIILPVDSSDNPSIARGSITKGEC